MKYAKKSISKDGLCFSDCQPFVRVIFKLLFHKQIEARTEAQHEAEAEGAKTMKPVDETEAIADVWKRIGEIQEELAHERRQRKKIQ